MGLVIEEGVGRGVTVRLINQHERLIVSGSKGVEYVLPREGYTEPGG